MRFPGFERQTLVELIRLAYPMVISQGAFAIMIFTDRYFMSKIGPLEMAAAMGGGIASFFSISLFIGLLSYANALVAQYLGAGQHAKCSLVVTQGLIITLCCMPLIVLITYFVGGIFSAMDHAPEQVALEHVYYSLLMYSSFLPLSKLCIASYFSGIGRTRVVMVCDVLGMLVNVPLSYVLIFGKFGLPMLGIVGAALGTIISSAFALLLFIIFYLQPNNRQDFQVRQSFRFDRGIMGRYIRLGMPSGLEMFLNIAAFNLFLLMFQSYGIAEAAAATIVFNWDILAFVPMLGLNIAVISLIGRFVGAGYMAKTNQVIAAGFFVSLSYTGVLGLIFITFRYPLVEIFISPGPYYQDIRDLTGFMMVGLATYVMADAVRLVSSAVLRGAGDTRWLMINTALLYWTMLFFQYLIIRVFDLGPRVSWLGFVVMIFAVTLICFGRLRGGRWRSREHLAHVMRE